jgi:hypothetical protein
MNSRDADDIQGTDGQAGATENASACGPAPFLTWRKKVALAGLAVLLLGGAALLWMEWNSLQTWYVLRGLKQADDTTREGWVARSVALGPCAVEGLLEGLCEADGPASENCALALAAMAREWGGADDRTAQLAQQIAKLCPKLPAPARARALCVVAGCCTDGSPATLHACVHILEEASQDTAPEVLEAALKLAGQLLPHTEQALPASRRLAGAALASNHEASQLLAIGLSQRPGMDLTEQVVGLLRTGTPAVRRAAVLTAGPSDAVREETLLACLHDDDEGVRKLARLALEGRGLRPEQMELGRLLTHPRPGSRVLVLDKLREVPDVDHVAWLRRLSQDPSPSVRTAALRLICERLPGELAERVDEMARTDPSPTVLQLARYYRSLRPDTLPVGGRR